MDNFEKDPRLLGFAKDHPDFFKMLLSVGEDLSIKPEDIEFTLLTQLVELSLSRDELHKVLSDLDIGPSSDGPSDQPPSSDGLNDQLNGVSLLESHNFNGQIPSDLVLNEEEVRASTFFRKPWIFSMHFLLWMVNRIHLPHRIHILRTLPLMTSLWESSEVLI